MKTTPFSLPRTLKGFVFATTVGVAFFVFIGATFASSLLYEHLLESRNRESSGEIAQQSVHAILEVLSRGGSRSQLNEVLAASKAAFPTTVEQLSVRNSEPAAASYSGTQRSVLPHNFAQAFRNGRDVVTSSGHYLDYAYPIVAKQECMHCHVNANEGSILGIIEMRHNLHTMSSTVRIYYIATFLVLGLLVLLAAVALTGFVASKLNRAARAFVGNVESVRTVNDLEKFDLKKVDFGFAEFDRAFDHVALLVDKIKSVAIDKSVLEFEIRLLEKLIIKSDVMRNWREFVGQLLLDINSIVEVLSLITLFRVEERTYECEIFWRNAPPAHTVEAFEAFLQKRLHNHANFCDNAILQVTHHVANEHGLLPEIDPQAMESQNKTLLLKTPRIGEIVGIGLQLGFAQENIRHMVIGSILTTLLNLVGSAKAIDKYTKDLEHHATRDQLTNLYNQRMFWELLEYEVARAKRHELPFALMILDIDNFKTINDRHGHHTGDAFLQAFADLLRTAVRKGDLLARYGGDEFCIILPGGTETIAHTVAQRIIEQLQGVSMEMPDGDIVKATTSIGIAISSNHGDDPKDLFLVADNMMYKAKNSGKNGIAFPSVHELPDVLRKAGKTAVIIQDALEQRALIPHFQPIANADSGAIGIHELLMRIRSGDQILVASEFIEEAERIGIAHKLDYLLIEEAFSQIKSQGYSGMLFINISPKSLVVDEFVERIGYLATQFEIAPGRVVFEMTERETVRNTILLKKFVLDIKRKGFCFAIDDFGSGYSSFQYIKCLPVDYIKIDGEFIRNMLHDEFYLAFVKSIVALAKELNIKTIAEYVEDEKIFAKGCRLGIDFAQGFHISHPSPTFHPSVIDQSRLRSEFSAVP